MGQVSPYLRITQDGYAHWCPGCEEMHPLPRTWSFNGDVNKPTFAPSFRHQGVKREFVDHRWTGEWIRDAAGDPVAFCCHYQLIDGVLNFCGDCTHSLAGQSVPLPELPEHYRDAVKT